MRRYLRDPIVLVSGAVVAIGLLIALLWGASTPDSARESAEDRETVVVTAPPEPADRDAADDPAGPLDLQEVSDLSDVVGRSVVAEATDVQGVPGDEGFWVDAGGESAWVQLSTAGESPYEIRGGQRVRFVGEVVAHGPDFAQRPEFSEVDAEALVEAGAHIEVDIADLTIVD
ncbi:hypothetical protein [Pseudonocardia humida]|uniref:Uncharacterized protein n=1 Tax=Pseudonocardia humida TaxID=2800819 RepID=A0ABT1ABU7_9PSEU|nr:hypothetical protein [Pseudonocardia humida]MCO1660410.1 hypothetical protein [Pseudonocardia humida]